MSIRSFLFGKNKQQPKPPMDAEKSAYLTYQRAYTEEEVYSESFQDFGLNNHNLTLLWMFNNIAEVNSIVTYIATLCSDAKLTHVKVLGNEKEKPINNSELIKLLNNPNEVNQGKTFLLNAYSAFFVFGNTYINTLVPIGFGTPSKLYNLPSYNMFPLPERRMNNYGEPLFGTDPRFNPIMGYNWIIDNQDKILELSEVLHIKDSNLNHEGLNWYLGQSRLFAAIESCNTLKFLYETVNTILSKRGAMGYIKRNKRPNEIETVLTPDQEKEVRKIVQKNYGVTNGKSPIAYTSADINYVKIDAPISDFIPTELRADMVKTLCRSLGNVPDSLFSSDGSSTYNNLSSNAKRVYSNLIIPIVNLFCVELTKKFGLNNINEKISADFGHIAELKDDEKVEAESEKIKDEVIRLRYDNDEITLNEKLIEMGLQSVANGNLRKSEIPITDQILANRIGVGGVQSLQMILADFNMSSEQKYYSLIYIFGLTEDQARKLAGENKPVQEPIIEQNGTEQSV